MSILVLAHVTMTQEKNVFLKLKTSVFINKLYKDRCLILAQSCLVKAKSGSTPNAKTTCTWWTTTHLPTAVRHRLNNNNTRCGCGFLVV